MRNNHPQLLRTGQQLGLQYDGTPLYETSGVHRHSAFVTAGNQLSAMCFQMRLGKDTNRTAEKFRQSVCHFPNDQARAFVEVTSEAQVEPALRRDAAALEPAALRQIQRNQDLPP